ncbi:MAG: GAF domain-containing protein [Anaerolineae bacterium]|nr:GAF domain-containing protein [Anaerolineae bacterium]
MQSRQPETEAKNNSLTHQQISKALARVGNIATNNNSCQAIITSLQQEIKALLHPKQVEVALYKAHRKGYQILDSNEFLSCEDPLAHWLSTQTVGIPQRLWLEEIPEAAHETAKMWLEKKRNLVIPLGKRGWIVLGPPQDSEFFTDYQQNILQCMSQPAAVGLERAVMVEDQDRRVKELEALYLITQAVNFTMPLDDIMELIYTQIKRVMPLQNFYLGLYHPHTKTLTYPFYVKGEQRIQKTAKESLEQTLTSTLVKTGHAIRTTDYVEECRRRGLETGDMLKPHAWMGVPLIAGDEIMGVMVTFADDERLVFNQEDQNFFTTTAAQAASILQRLQLYEGLETRARQLGTLNEVGKLLASSLDINEVLDLVVKHAAKLLDSEAGSLLLLDDNSGDLIFQISSGPTGDQLVGLKVPAGKGIAGVAFAENRPIIVSDALHDTRWYNSFDRDSEFITRSLIAVPLNARGRTIGVLEVLNHKNDLPFTEEDTELLMAFGAQAAIAIENARLFTMTDQALQARLEELTTLQHIDRQLNASLNYREVMGQTLAWAIRLTGATIGLIAALQEEEDGTQGLRLLAHHGYPEDIFKRYSEEELWPLDKGFVGQAVRNQNMDLLQSVVDNPNYIGLVPGMKLQLTVPIKRENHVIGVIALESEAEASFNNESVESVVRLADHAAIAIENARLFQKVQDANNAKTEFISFVSHELKQPMTSMKGYTDLLRKGIGGPLNEQQQQFLQVIRTNVERMNRLVSDLLDVSRIESGRLRLEMGDVQPEEVVSESVRAFEQEIVAKEQNLHVDIKAPLPAVYGDRGRLIQVLTNLISNASKYTPEKGNITIHVKPVTMGDRPFVRWSVADTGIGMTEAELERLFTKYFRSDNPIVRNIQGTGLGLVITQSIIELHNGQIWVESEVNKGSTFSFTIPVTS